MKVAFFSARAYDIGFIKENPSRHQFSFIEERLDSKTAELARGHSAICISANDIADESVLPTLASVGIGLIVIRSSGIDNVNPRSAYENGITVKCLPGYSPEAIAEYAAGLLLTLNRRIHTASERVKKGDFSIDGLMGFNLHHKTVGIIGLGRIGLAFANIMKGFGCEVLFSDPNKKMAAQNNAQAIGFSDLLHKADIVSLHCSLNETSNAIINRETLGLFKPGAFLINTARGKLVDTKALLEALEKGIIGAYAADVYEGESDFYYQTFQSVEDLADPILKKLIQHPNVLLTSHQAFFTKEAVQQMTRTILNELTYYESLINGSADRLMI